MDGLLLRLLETGRQEPRFWKLFGSIRSDLDRLFWCFLWQPWSGTADDFRERDVMEPFEDDVTTSVQLWRPGSLSQFADRFAEEEINMWAMEPTRDNPRQLATAFNKTPWGRQSTFIEEHSRVWLLYTDSSCWEIYARRTNWLDSVRDALHNRASVAVYESRSDQRGKAFGAAGLSEVWAALKGG